MDKHKYDNDYHWKKNQMAEYNKTLSKAIKKDTKMYKKMNKEALQSHGKKINKQLDKSAKILRSYEKKHFESKPMDQTEYRYERGTLARKDPEYRKLYNKHYENAKRSDIVSDIIRNFDKQQDLKKKRRNALIGTAAVASALQGLYLLNKKMSK